MFHQFYCLLLFGIEFGRRQPLFIDYKHKQHARAPERTCRYDIIRKNYIAAELYSQFGTNLCDENEVFHYIWLEWFSAVHFICRQHSELIVPFFLSPFIFAFDRMEHSYVQFSIPDPFRKNQAGRKNVGSWIWHLCANKSRPRRNEISHNVEIETDLCKSEYAFSTRLGHSVDFSAFIYRCH